MTEPEQGNTPLTDPDNDPQFYFSSDDDEDEGGFSADEARAFLARPVAPVGASTQEVPGA